MRETNPNMPDDNMPDEIANLARGDAEAAHVEAADIEHGSIEPASSDNEAAERAETDAMNEAWSALGQLLDAAQTPLDEATLVDAVCRRLARRRVQSWRLALALAASILALVGGAWMSMSGDTIGNHASVVTMPGKATSRRASPALPSSVEANETQDGARGESSPAAGWNDEWDDELAQTQEQVLATRESWRQPADRLTVVRERMDELEAEFGGEAL
jgi:hypothetical protein